MGGQHTLAGLRGHTEGSIGGTQSLPAQDLLGFQPGGTLQRVEFDSARLERSLGESGRSMTFVLG
jgi:hypothetical protein